MVNSFTFFTSKPRLQPVIIHFEAYTSSGFQIKIEPPKSTKFRIRRYFLSRLVHSPFPHSPRGGNMGNRNTFPTTLGEWIWQKRSRPQQKRSFPQKRQVATSKLHVGLQQSTQHYSTTRILNLVPIRCMHARAQHMHAWHGARASSIDPACCASSASA